MDNAESEAEPELPDSGARLDLTFVEPPHPAVVPIDELLSQCGLRTQRRSGPGGQHRNKTSSGVFLLHHPTGVSSEATERRSQADNRVIAANRLRFRLAVEVRTRSLLAPACESPADPAESEYRRRYHGQPLRMNDANDAKPAVLALVLNDLHFVGGLPKLVAPQWSVTTSGMVTFIKSHPPAFTLLNTIRRHHGRRALK